MEHERIVELLTRLRESSDAIFKIYTEGSCFRLYEILKVIIPDAIAYWSDRDSHCITQIEGRLYDIGGEIHPDYKDDKHYYIIPKEQLKAHSLMKSTHKEDEFGVIVEKYKDNGNN